MKKVVKSGKEWGKILTPDQFKLLRKKATEAPFTGSLLHNSKSGTYNCAACNSPLFSSKTKYDSGSGWPSFWGVINEGSVELKQDNSHGMNRTEVVCSTCGSHLGHLFEDGPGDKTGLRYCVNSGALNFKEAKRDS